MTDSSSKEQLVVAMSIHLTIASLKILCHFWNVVVGQALAEMLLDFLTNMVLILPTYVGKPMMVPVTWQEGSMALVHVSCLNFPLLSMYTVPPTA